MSIVHVASPKSWRIHIGPAKTATTHIQNTFAQIFEELSDEGTTYIPRQSVLRYFPPGIRRPSKERISSRLRFLYKLHKMTGKQDSLGSSVLISEELLPGEPKGLLGSVFFPGFEGNLACFDLIGRWRELNLFIAVRNPATLLPSAYGQALRRQEVEPGFDRIRQFSRNTPPSWYDLILRIKRAVPSANLHIWRYEDYSANQWTILSKLTGIELKQRAPLPPPPETMSPTTEAIRRLEKLDSVNPRDVLKISNRIVAEAANGTKFEPFTEEEVGLLEEKYDEDVDRLKREFGEQFLSF